MIVADPSARTVTCWVLDGAAYRQTDRSALLAVTAAELESSLAWPHIQSVWKLNEHEDETKVSLSCQWPPELAHWRPPSAQRWACHASGKDGSDRPDLSG
jgi:hypothetical protein